jgi:hypothetical protein
MKNMKIIILVACVNLMAWQSFSQSVNWASLKSDNKHIVHVTTGFDYGLVYGLGYSHKIKSKMPILLDVSYSFPSGGQLLDDFKTKIGGQARLCNIRNFQFSASIHGIYRQHENTLVRMQNFGSEMTGVIGYYKPKWFVAGEVGFDKAIVTHFKHSENFKNDFPNTQEGWYEPSTGGNFHYGIQTGYSFKNSDLTLTIGKFNTQDFKTTPLIPYYFQLGYNYKFKQTKNK